GEFQLVGASPELLVKEENRRIIPTNCRHCQTKKLTRKGCGIGSRSKQQLERSSRTRHASRSTESPTPASTQVDRLMVVERFSHVQHLVSEVAGVKTGFDGFRSIFPCHC